VQGALPIPPGVTVTQRMSAAAGRYAASAPAPLHLAWDLGGTTRLAQDVPVTVVNPVHMVVLPPGRGILSVRLENPSGDPFKASLDAAVRRDGAPDLQARSNVELRHGESEKTVHLPIDADAVSSGGSRIEVWLHEEGQPETPG